MTILKRCPGCKAVKKESQFRYIEYFDKRRSICKRCEALERRKRRRLVEKHVEDYGVTPGILKKLHRETNEKAKKEAEKTVLAGLPKKKRKAYLLGQLGLRVFVLVILALTM